MYSIYKLCTHPTVDFAAEELKKYLRMMMPRSGEIPIFCSPDATTGFRLGLMADLGLDMSDTDDPTLDDIVYLETNTDGGVIAGSNPCALLIAVYRYLRAQGCRWLFPGVDGEWIPCIQTLVPVSSRRMAAHRYRGQCNEGAEFQQCMLDAIDFTPKIGMNTFMMEFDIPSQYYQKYYGHADNLVREPEPVTNETILQWKRQCEVEIKKRGLHFHDTTGQNAVWSSDENVDLISIDGHQICVQGYGKGTVHVITDKGAYEKELNFDVQNLQKVQI